MAVIILGSAGSGKGTLSKNLRAYGFEHICSSDLFRDRLKNDPEFNQQVADHMQTMERGRLLPDKLVWSTILQKLLLYPDGTNLVFDGCARTMGQMQLLLDYLERLNYRVTIVRLDLSEDACRGRMIFRHENATPEEKRQDDLNAESVEERLHGYREHLPSIIGYVQGKGKIVHGVDATQSPEDILIDVCNVVGLPITITT